MFSISDSKESNQKPSTISEVEDGLVCVTTQCVSPMIEQYSQNTQFSRPKFNAFGQEAVHVLQLV